MTEQRYIHLDAVGGMAGDMFVAAILDAIPSLRPRVLDDVEAVLPSGCGTPELSPGSSAGLAVLRFGLTAAEPHGTTAPHSPEQVRENEHGHGHGHEHGHGHGHGHGHDHGHPHRNGADCHYPALVRRITEAPLASGTAAEAISILRLLAEAESRVHGVPLEDVHFHEVADWDSLMDVVAAGSIVAALQGTSWTVSPLPRGAGLVRTAHGLLPVPAPATAEILKGFLWRDDGIPGERVTPTGAAILAHLVQIPQIQPGAGRLLSSGTGAGTRTLSGMPNILRALVFGPKGDEPKGDGDAVGVLSFDIDDMTGEEIGLALDNLRAATGVIDVTVGCRQGKKGRPVTDFRLLVHPRAMDAVERLCFLETSTIGLRRRIEGRRCLERIPAERMADGRTLPVKVTLRPDGERTEKVESDALAGHSGLAGRRRLAVLARKEDSQS
ncbi:MAG: LarC family nickel insertion protein [Telmatospirillum sp.]|nr:LarC family nickel insertion protein [Telmatospirillum sp.]